MTTRHFNPEQIEEAREVLSRAAMLHVAGLFGPELAGVDVPDSDCVRYLLEQEQGIDLDIADYLGMK